MSLKCSSSTRVVSALWPPFSHHSFLFLPAGLYSAWCITKEASTFLLHVGRFFSSLRSCWWCLCQQVLIWADFPLFSSRITLKGRGSHQLRIYLWNSGGWGLDTRSSICIEHLNSLVEKVRKQAWPDKSLGKERLSLPNQGVFPRLAQSRESVPAPWGQRTDSEVGGSSKIWLLFRKTSFWMAQENIPKFNIGCRHSNHLWRSPRIMLPSTWDWDECGQKCLLYSHCPENPQGRERAISSVWTWSRRPQAHKGISVEQREVLYKWKHRYLTLRKPGISSWTAHVRDVHLNIFTLCVSKKHKHGNGLRPSEPPKGAPYINRFWKLVGRRIENAGEYWGYILNLVHRDIWPLAGCITSTSLSFLICEYGTKVLWDCCKDKGRLTNGSYYREESSIQLGKRCWG